MRLMWCLAAIAAMSLPAVANFSPADPTLVVHGRVIDGTGAAPIEGGVVVLAGDRIACVGTPVDCEAPAGTPAIEADGGTILPGLIDLHVHARPHYLAWFLAAGVTTIRDANNSFADVEANLAVTDRPRIFWSGPLLDGPNTIMRAFGEEGVRRPTDENIGAAWTQEVTAPEEARQAVDLLADRGATFVKLYEQLALDVYRAAAERARARGLAVMTDLGMHHTRGLTGAEVDALQAIAAGTDSIEHASGYALAYQRLGGDPRSQPFDPALLDQLARATVQGETAVVPTLSVMYSYADDVTNISGLPMADRLPRDMQEFFEAGANRRTDEGRASSRLAYEFTVALTTRILELGGAIGAGSDAPAGVFNLPGGGLHRELELLVRAGLTPLQALHAATGAAGGILGQPDLGVLRAGAIADLLIVAGNPAEDIKATRNVRSVIQAGKVLKELVIEQSAE
jgi:cytosine/adenosine deaminase-related metal-dependent hydrolase